jgi:pheromone shutdown protein TraB
MLSGIIGSLVEFFGPMGNPAWWVLGAFVFSIFLARWASAIRTLLPFVGAGTVIALVLWALTSLGVLDFHTPKPKETVSSSRA